MSGGNGKPEIAAKMPKTGSALARATQFDPLIEPALSVGQRCEVAYQMIDRLCEQFLLGGSLRPWQVVNAINAVVAKWERLPRNGDGAELDIARRFVRDHVEVCVRCKGAGTVAK